MNKKAQFSTVPRQVDKFLTNNKGNIPTHFHPSSASYLYNSLRNCVRVAKHFELPHRTLYGLGEDLTEEEVEATAEAGLRLPFPAITISRRIDDSDMFLVAWDESLVSAVAQAANTKNDRPAGVSQSTIYAHAFVLSNKKEWMPDLVTIMFDGDDFLESRVVDGGEEVGVKYSIGWADKNVTENEEGEIENFTAYLIRDITELCTYLKRKSTTLETHRESSLRAKLGSKKKKDHKAFYEIHRVVVNATPKVTVVSEPKGGTHASPRWHERRGYWRTMKKSGKTVWVRACEVGKKSNGMVYKDYEVAVDA